MREEDFKRQKRDTQRSFNPRLTTAPPPPPPPPRATVARPALPALTS